MLIRITKQTIIVFCCTLIVANLLFSIPVFVTSTNTTIYYPIEMWLEAQDIFALFYPLLCTVPFCWELRMELQGGFLKYVSNRLSPTKYLGYRYIGSLFFVLCVIFSSSFFSAILAQYVITPSYPITEPSHIGMYLWGDVLVSSPMKFALVSSVWRAILAGLYFTFGFFLVMISKNSFIALTGPFIYSILENYFTSIIGRPAYSIVTSFLITRLAPGFVREQDLLVGPLVLLAICIILFVLAILKFHQGESKWLNIA